MKKLSIIRKMANAITVIGCCLLVIGTVSCSDMFETDSDRQIFDPDLDQKTDSMFYTLGILKGLQQVGDQYVMLNEMRGDLVKVNQYTETDLRQLAEFSATTENKYDSAYKYYRIINNCNYFVAHRDTMLLTGSRRVAIPEYVEALAVRAWAYLQLAKTYGTVPFYTQPLVSIGDAESVSEQRDLQGIVDELAPELQKYSGTFVPTYGNISAGVLNSSDSDNPVEKTIASRYAMIHVDVILGDLFLETHQYEKAAQYYFKFLSDNKWQIRRAYITPTTYREQLGDKMPNNITVATTDGFSWSSIFSTTSSNDIITYIPLAANRLRGVTTELPRYFGYDFYSTTGGAASSNARYLLERQIDASDDYIALSDAQEYYYTVNGLTGLEVTKAEIGDMRRQATLRQVAKNDSAFAVMIKFSSANIPLYRTATVYLRLAEALNRMGYPDAAFAILKDGISDNLQTYVLKYDETDLTVKGRYLRPETIEMLTTTIPFLSSENIMSFSDNWGIHARGANYTQGAYSPYQMDDVVGRKLDELRAQFPEIPADNLTLQDTINAMEDIICDEMALELAFEGSRFGDLTRMARHKNHDALYGSNFGSMWLKEKLSYKNPVKDLLDERNWYLPMK